MIIILLIWARKKVWKSFWPRLYATSLKSTDAKFNSVVPWTKQRDQEIAIAFHVSDGTKEMKSRFRCNSIYSFFIYVLFNCNCRRNFLGNEEIFFGNISKCVLTHKRWITFYDKLMAHPQCLGILCVLKHLCDLGIFCF